MGGKGSGNRTKSNPFTAKRADSVDPDTNARTIDFTLAIGRLPDFDHGSEEATWERVDLFFDMCKEHGMRPLVGNFSIAMGMSKQELWAMLNGDRSCARIGVTDSCKWIYKKVLSLIDSNFEQVLMDMKNPISGIYYSKSNLGWREAPTETIVTHKSDTPRLSGGDRKAIEARYAERVGLPPVEAEAEVVDDSGTDVPDSH